MMTADHTETAPPKDDPLLLLFLRVVGGITLLAYAAAVMPEKWMIETAAFLGIEPFPDSPLTYYLARHLSVLYGFVGVALLVISFDLQRYRPLVRLLALGTMIFGVMQLVVDAMSAMPMWWTLRESVSTFFGGALLCWLDRRRR